MFFLPRILTLHRVIMKHKITRQLMLQSKQQSLSNSRIQMRFDQTYFF